MNRLEDMGRFPTVVYAGATANVLVSILLFYWLHGRVGGSLPVGFVCAVVLLAINLSPVVLLRRREGAEGLASTPARGTNGLRARPAPFRLVGLRGGERQPVLLAHAGLGGL